MKKDTLLYPFDLKYQIFAIASVLKDYRISFFINEMLKIDLKRVDDIHIDYKGKIKVEKFEQFFTEDELSQTSYFLVQNKSAGSLLLSSLKSFDYLLIIASENELENVELIHTQLKSIANIQIVHNVEKLSKNDQHKIEHNILYKE